MARSRDMNASAPKKNRKTTRDVKEEQGGLGEGSFGKDPWTFVDCRDAAAGSHCFPVASSTKQCSQTALKSQLVSHFGSECPEDNKAQSTPTPTSTTDADQAREKKEEDAIVLPTPIHATIPCKLVAADGRVEYIYTPIGGFEHLFKDSSNTRQPAGQPQQLKTPAKKASLCTTINTPSATRRSQPDLTRNDSQQPHVGSPRILNVPSKKMGPKLSKQNALKRSRSVAQGLSQSSRHGRRTNGDDGGNEHYENEEETTVINEPSKTFHIGDIEAIKIFFRYRIDELTMKPVRGMVTSWLRQLEPKRKGGYGPYHKMLPCEAPADATPPWWPHNVPYVEPAHLDKDGLLTLAVDVMMQHRDIAIDEVKRNRGSWTATLRTVATYEIEMTPPEQYSSSKNPTFSRMMKERAEKEILPSLFDISQSYEDYVIQNSLWRYTDVAKAPVGKEITWQFVPRPPKQIRRTPHWKRPRTTTSRSIQRRQPALEVHSEDSGDDTEIDEAMVSLSNKILRRAQAQAARRGARAAVARVVSRDRVSPEPTMKVSSPVTIIEETAAATPQRCSDLTDSKPAPASTPNSSFDQSMNHLCLREDTKGGSQSMPDSQVQQAHHNTQSLDERMQYHDRQASYPGAAFQPAQGVGSFSNSGPSHFTPFTAHNYVDTAQFSMFNHSYALQMGHPSFGTNMGASNNVVYPYESDTMFAPMDLSMPMVPPQTNTPFDGLPYDFAQDSPRPQHGFSRP